jgi:hypothetical protein
MRSKAIDKICDAVLEKGTKFIFYRCRFLHNFLAAMASPASDIAFDSGNHGAQIAVNHGWVTNNFHPTESMTASCPDFSLQIPTLTAVISL